MEDITPKLIDELEKVFNQKIRNSGYISGFLQKVKKGTATLTDTQLYSKELGQILGNTFKEVLREDTLPDGRLYWNIAERTMLPMLNNNYDLVTNASVEVQKIIDIKDGIGIKPIKPDRPDDRIKGILDNVTVDNIEFEEVKRRMTEPVVNITEHFFDAFILVNADLRYRAGLHPKIIRRVKGKACKWCKNLAGVYDYEEVKDKGNDVFRRHENCHCQVTYESGKERQNVWTKQFIN